MDGTKVIERLEQMLARTKADRQWYHDQARATDPKNPGMMADAAACAVREKALEEAIKVVRGERG